jgi:cyclohexanecarboxylate-CoA ligase
MSSAADAADLSARDDTRLTPELADSYLAGGGWRNVALSSYLHEAAAEAPETIAAVGYDGADEGRRGAITYAELKDRADRLAAGLAGLGVGAGDVVAIMLPNGPEFAALIWAVLDLGAVYSGIPVSYGEREAEFMLRRSRAKVLIVPETFGRRDNYVELALAAREQLPTLEHLVLVGGGSVAGLTSYCDLEATAPALRGPVRPSALAAIGFTSGTTGEPKGIMNTHATLDAVLSSWAGHVGDTALGAGTVNLVASPIGHHTGFLWGVLLSAYLKATAVFVERWNPARAIEIIREEGVTVMFGAPTFLQDLIHQPDLAAEDVATLRTMVVAGAPIPRTLVPLAAERLDCFVCPAWGMTEYGIGVSAAPALAPDRIAATDGAPIAGCKVRVLDDGGAPVPAGTEGELQITGPGLFLGYLDRPDFTAEAFDGIWLRTGDRAVLDADGLLTLKGRTKDIIIRGGENIPAVEIENLLHTHPAILEAAVVGIPDERLGERACAVLVTDGTALDLPQLSEHLLGQKLSKHFLPERVEIVAALPKTASGKVRKKELREQLSVQAEPNALSDNGSDGKLTK